MTCDEQLLRRFHSSQSCTRCLSVLLVSLFFAEVCSGWSTHAVPKRRPFQISLGLHATYKARTRVESMSRRRAFNEALNSSVSSIVIFTSILPTKAVAKEKAEGFVSAAYSRPEYTNSITASRDTNVSPKEVYDVIRSLFSQNGGNHALDVGAGAGVSTQTLYEMGYTAIDALDWSSDAWDLNVAQNGHCPDTVRFYNLDDERFMNFWRKSIGEKYDVIVFNFAVNKNKADHFATELLKTGGVLLAPVNAQQDYWLKQTYMVLNSEGKLLWSASDVGAWSVQFQPDVTQDTCQGIWCPPYNGFQKQ